MHCRTSSKRTCTVASTRAAARTQRPSWRGCAPTRAHPPRRRRPNRPHHRQRRRRRNQLLRRPPRPRRRTAMADAIAVGARSPRRSTELALVVFGLVLTLVAFANVGLAHNSHLPTDMVTYGLGFAVLFGAAHLAVRWLAPYADPVLLPLAVALNGIGLVLIQRLDLAYADSARAAHRAVPRGAAPLQLVWTVIGVALFNAV